ncbi:hypothetical protein SK128_025344 [Halocaridina rubra]|uniref:Uncharacterized protein n=1 Tax=Halocaridina rubra TaxID=373956 RepID=A0AAN8XR24_HALRR
MRSQSCHLPHLVDLQHAWERRGGIPVPCLIKRKKLKCNEERKNNNLNNVSVTPISEYCE